MGARAQVCLTRGAGGRGLEGQGHSRSWTDGTRSRENQGGEGKPRGRGTGQGPRGGAAGVTRPWWTAPSTLVPDEAALAPPRDHAAKPPRASASSSETKVMTHTHRHVTVAWLMPSKRRPRPETWKVRVGVRQLPRLHCRPLRTTHPSGAYAAVALGVHGLRSPARRPRSLGKAPVWHAAAPLPTAPSDH